MKKERNIAFVVELLLLFVILLLVIVVITKTLMTSRSQSLHAKYLTEAVCLAEDAATAERQKEYLRAKGVEFAEIEEEGYEERGEEAEA